MSVARLPAHGHQADLSWPRCLAPWRTSARGTDRRSARRFGTCRGSRHLRRCHFPVGSTTTSVSSMARRQRLSRRTLTRVRPHEGLRSPSTWSIKLFFGSHRFLRYIWPWSLVRTLPCLACGTCSLSSVEDKSRGWTDQAPPRSRPKGISRSRPSALGPVATGPNAPHSHPPSERGRHPPLTGDEAGRQAG